MNNIETVFKAFVVRENDDGQITRSIENKSISDLPIGDVLIQVKFAGLNYKDALSASAHKGITKAFPHTPGVDASGIVRKSSSTDFIEGDEVMVTGYDLGMMLKLPRPPRPKLRQARLPIPMTPALWSIGRANFGPKPGCHDAMMHHA